MVAPVAERPVALPASAGTISEQSIRAHLEFLASDALNGRGSGTRDEWLAATYIASQFRLWGLEPMGDGGGYVQTVEMSTGQASSAPVLTVGHLALTHGREMLVAALASAKATGRLWKYTPGAAVPDRAFVLLRPGERPALTGAICLLASETPEQRAQWSARGATMPSIAARPTKLIEQPTTRTSLIYVDTATHAALTALPDGTEVSLVADIRMTTTGSTWNAVGRLTGSEPTPARDVIVLSAHLDHVGARDGAPGTDTIYNGADDDASGTVAVMTIAAPAGNATTPHTSAGPARSEF